MKEDLSIKAGDRIGMVMRYNRRYELCEIPIRSIEPGPGGGLIRTVMLTPYTVNEVAENTALLLQDQRIILTMRPFLVMGELRDRIGKWIAWANDNPDAVRSVLHDPVIHTEEVFR